MSRQWKASDVHPMKLDRVRFHHVARHLYRPVEHWEQVITLAPALAATIEHAPSATELDNDLATYRLQPERDGGALTLTWTLLQKVHRAPPESIAQLRALHEAITTDAREAVVYP